MSSSHSRAAAHCPSFEAISRAFSAGDPGLLGPHIKRCAACGAAWSDLEALRRAGQALPWHAPSDERAAQLEDELLIRARAEVVDRDRSGRRTRAVVLGSALAVAASIALAVIFTGSERSAPEWPAEAPAVAESVVAPAAPSAVHDVAPAAGVQRGTIRPRANGAKFEHFTRHDAAPGLRTDEIVHVAEGVVQVDVTPLARDERFRVITLDAEVEVRGTSFDVEVDHDKLIAVRVTSGLVEVRPRDGAARMLSAGQSWRFDEPAVEVAAAVESVPAREIEREQELAREQERELARERVGERERAREPVREDSRESAPLIEEPIVVPPPAPSPSIPDATPAIPDREPSAAERAFDEGWELLRGGDAARAAERFAAVGDDANDPLIEDAMYWRAVALGRAKKFDDAESAMRRFLDRFNSSVRSGEVSVMLGRRLLDRGAFGEARLRFSAAKDDPSPRVRKAAEAGLADLDTRRDQPTK